MGEMQVPADAYYGAQTARAVENFPISDLRFNRRFIAALGLIKSAAAEVNNKLGLLDDKKKSLIQRSAQEVIDGKLDSQFVVDIFQTGSGTSTNMNANEVIASRANELATGQRGGKEPIHPNDHVNMEQSSNCFAFFSSVAERCSSAGTSDSFRAIAAATCMAVGITSFDDCSMFT